MWDITKEEGNNGILYRVDPGHLEKANRIAKVIVSVKYLFFTNSRALTLNMTKAFFLRVTAQKNLVKTFSTHNFAIRKLRGSSFHI